MNFEETNGIQTGAGVKLVIYGQEGVGKTSLAAQLPGAVFTALRMAADLIFFSVYLDILPDFQYVRRYDDFDPHPAVAGMYVYHPPGRRDQRDPGRIWVHRETQG